MTCIWIHLNRKAQNDNSKLQIPIPHSLKLHHEYASLNNWTNMGYRSINTLKLRTSTCKCFLTTVRTYDAFPLISLLCVRFLQQSLRNKTLGMSDYKIALLCNAYSTNSECFTLPMGVLVETIYGNGSMRINLPGTNCMASGSVTPLPMNLLDSLTVHAKMR